MRKICGPPAAESDPFPAPHAQVLNTGPHPVLTTRSGPRQPHPGPTCSLGCSPESGWAVTWGRSAGAGCLSRYEQRKGPSRGVRAGGGGGCKRFLPRRAHTSAGVGSPLTQGRLPSPEAGLKKLTPGRSDGHSSGPRGVSSEKAPSTDGRGGTCLRPTKPGGHRVATLPPHL